MEIFGLYAILAAACGIWASSRGRSGFGWFLLALVLSPLIAFILIAVLRDASQVEPKPSPWTHVKCPDCQELVKREARKCKHCGCALVPQ